MPSNLSKQKSFFIVTLSYLIALGASAVFLKFSGLEDPIWNMAGADFLATVIIFLFSLAFRNSSIYDPYWSVYPMFIAFWWFFEFGGDGDLIRNMIVLGLVLAWGIRLTYNWARSWPGMVHEDWRYTKLSEDTGPMYWIVSFLGIHLFPTVLVFAGCLPLYFIFQYDAPLGLIDALALLVALGAIIIETVADNQLLRFRKAKASGVASGIMDSGLWGYSRHPNYFGEIMFWVGLFLFAWPVFISGTYWIAAGGILMIILFTMISIPMMEKRQISKEGYAEYKRRVSSLIPLPPRKS